MISRRSAMKSFATIGAAVMLDLQSAARVLIESPTTPRMPVLFVGHGSPLNAITDNPFAKVWKKIGVDLPTPKAIVCVSAHWETKGTKVTAMEQPRTIHDFGGFPDELYAMQYPAPGSPALAEEIAEITKKSIELDHQWGLDHGTWSVLTRMYPEASIPVVQISLDVGSRPEQHVNLARQLSALRNHGVLIIGSGNIVHNLRKLSTTGTSYDWAHEFDVLSAKHITNRDVMTLANYHSLGHAAQLSIPTNEHYLPMIYALAMTANDDELTFFNEKIELGSVGMRSFIASQSV